MGVFIYDRRRISGNAEWFVKVFSDIRLRYPAYQIAIFKVTAPAASSADSSSIEWQRHGMRSV